MAWVSGAASDHELVTDLSQARLAWAGKAPIRHAIVWTPTGYGGFSSPIVADDKVFFNQFRASGAATCDHRTDAPQEVIDGEKRRAIAADDEIFCFDARTGQLLWKVVFPDAAVNQPLKDKHCMYNQTGCYHDDKVYMMGFTWRLYCLDANIGKLIWQGDIGKAHQEAEKQKQQMIATRKKWNLRGGGNSFLAVADGVLFVNNYLGGTNGYDAKTGKLLWTVPGRPMRWVRQGKECVLCLDGRGALRCVQPRTGKELWGAAVGQMGWSKSFLLTGDYLLTQSGNWKQGTGTPAMWKLSVAGATKLWDKDIGYSHPAGGVHCGDGESFYIRWMWHAGAKMQKEDRSSTRIVAATGEVAAVSNKVPSGGWHGMQWLCDGRVLSSRDTCHGFGYLRMLSSADLKQMGGQYTSQGGSRYDVPMAYPYVDGRLFLRGMYRVYCYDLRARSTVSPRVGLAPLKVTFKALPWSTDPPGVHYEWDFGDGTTGSGATVEHTCGAAGEAAASVYQSRLTVVHSARRQECVGPAITAIETLRAAKPTRTIPGLRVEYYEEPFRSFPGLTTLKPTATFTADRLSAELGRRNDQFVLRFEGYLEAPRSGMYELALQCDDQGRLWLDGKLVTVRVGLEAGKHHLAFDYIQSRWGRSIRLARRAPGIERMEEVPASAFSREP